MKGGAVTFGEIVGIPDGVGETKLVVAGTPVVLFSDATGMTKEGNEDIDGIPDVIYGEDVTFVPVRSDTLGEAKGGIVPEELLAGIAGTPDEADTMRDPVDELLKDIGSDPEATVDTVGGIERLEVIASPVDELLKEGVGKPEEPVELRNPDRFDALGWGKVVTVGEELFDEIVEAPDGLEVVRL